MFCLKCIWNFPRDKSIWLSKDLAIDLLVLGLTFLREEKLKAKVNVIDLMCRPPNSYVVGIKIPLSLAPSVLRVYHEQKGHRTGDWAEIMRSGHERTIKFMNSWQLLLFAQDLKVAILQTWPVFRGKQNKKLIAIHQKKPVWRDNLSISPNFNAQSWKTI